MKIDNLLNIPRLGFGLMRLPIMDGDGTKIDLDKVCSMVDAFMEKGFTYFDTAYPYHSGFSEKAVRKILVERYDREEFLLASKMPGWELDRPGVTPQKIFDEQLERTGAGYFDFYLLHSIEKCWYPVYEKTGCFTWAQEMKKQGKIRHFGFSFHDDAELLDRILGEHPEVEFVQLQLNYLDWEDPVIQSRRTYEVCKKHGVPIVVMEPVKGGTLANLPEDEARILKEINPDASLASWALRFVASLDGIMVVLSGMSNWDQMQDNLHTMWDFKPLDDKEQQAVSQVAKQMLNKPQIGCTACRYCVDGCPKKIVIPELFRSQNSFYLYGKNERATNYYNSATAGRGRASDCIKCGKCETSCPQHLPIRELLVQVAENFG